MLSQTVEKLDCCSKITKSFGQAFSKACGFLGQRPKSIAAAIEILRLTGVQRVVLPAVAGMYLGSGSQAAKFPFCAFCYFYGLFRQSQRAYRRYAL